MKVTVSFVVTFLIESRLNVCPFAKFLENKINAIIIYFFIRFKIGAFSTMAMTSITPRA